MNVRGDFLGSPHGTNTTGVVCKKSKRKVQGMPQSQTAALPSYQVIKLSRLSLIVLEYILPMCLVE